MLVGVLPPAGLLTLLSCSLPTLMGRMVGVNCRVSSPPPPNPPPRPEFPSPSPATSPHHICFLGDWGGCNLAECVLQP